MLAGYLPFDDDPANPEGDNINLLYKYITTTALTFPEYVTPHARDLLRRILVPDPRNRADLFEVARHSWLSEYHHVVSHITSSTTNIADIANSTVPSGMAILYGALSSRLTESFPGDQDEVPGLARSASVREPAQTAHQGSPSPVGALNHQQARLAQDDDEDSTIRKRNVNRHTIQAEYVKPQSHTSRAEAPTTASAAATRGEGASQGLAGTAAPPATRSKPLPLEPSIANEATADYPTVPPSNNQKRMAPPTRPGRDVPRSVSDSAGAFSVKTSQPPASRPSTGNAPPTSGSVRSDPRLPTKGSYGQPVAPTVEAANAQGRVTQPTQPANGRGYNISAPIPQQVPTHSISRVPVPVRNNDTAAPTKSHHRRTSTLSSLGEKLFGRSGSFMGSKQQGDGSRGKKEKKYPPTSMKDAFPADNAPRISADSKRSFSFGIGKKRSVDLESQQAPEEKPRRFSSLLPSTFSLRGLTGGSKEQDSESDSPVPQDFPQPPRSGDQRRPSIGHDPPPSGGHNRNMPTDSRPSESLNQHGQHHRSRSTATNFSRPPQYQPASNDVYGGTGVYSSPSGAYPQSSNATPMTGRPEYGNSTNQSRPLYPEGFNSQDSASRPPIHQNREGRGVVQKPNNRNFNQAYEYEQAPNRHEGSSGAARKVMDYFRRRKAKADTYQ